MNINEFVEEIWGEHGISLFPKQKEILNKFYDGNYRELVLALGRRSGKDFLSTILALYETKKLLDLGDPFGYYKLARGNPIFIMLISCSTDQSRILFAEFRESLNRFPELLDRVGHMEAEKIHFLTDHDKEQLKKKGKNAKIKGSVIVMAAGTKSECLLGKRIYTLIFSEVSSYTNPDRVYNALCPATADFINPDTGRLDSKIISVSSPRPEDEMLPKLYYGAEFNDNRLAFNLPTWVVNPSFSEEFLRKEFKFMSDDEFSAEFGAEFLPNSDNETVSIRLSGSMINTLKRMSREIAYKENRDYTYVDAIRSSIKDKIAKYASYKELESQLAK